MDTGKRGDGPVEPKDIALIVLIFVLIVIAVVAIVRGLPPARADSYSYVDDDDNHLIMQEVANALADVEHLFGTGPLTAETAWMPAEYFAAAQGHSIVVNKVWSTGSYEAMAAGINDDIVSGYHNGGCTPARTIALHEAAHVIDNMRGRAPRYEAQAVVGYGPRPDLRGVLSGYSFDRMTGAVDAGEALAEAFQAVMCGTAGPEERELYEMLVG